MDMTAYFGPGSDFHSMEKKILITSILKHIRSYEAKDGYPWGSLTIEPESWFLLWLAEISSLREWAKEFEQRTSRALLHLNTLTRNGVIKKMWLSRAETGKSAEISEETEKDCEFRDSQCIITKEATPAIKVSRIIPSSLSKLEGTHKSDFWATLESFWSSKRVDAWKSLAKSTESLSNLISLAPSAQKYWDESLWAIKPLGRPSSDGKSIVVQFFWLRPGENQMHITTTTMLPEEEVEDYLVPSPVLHGDLRKGGGERSNERSISLVNCETEKPIKSGEKITLTTPDPDRWPLPSFELFEMQWNMQRLCALSAVEEDHDEYYDFDDYDNYDDSDAGFESNTVRGYEIIDW